MNKEIKAKWVAALRSGEYKQTKKKLHGPTGFCCLGVLCDIHSKETGEQWMGPKIKSAYLQEKDTLPYAVQKWAGLPDCNPSVLDFSYELAGVNDDGITFDWIAAIIETEL